MRRRYTSAEYTGTIRLIRDRVPTASITADVIVGFPGETDEDFQFTYDLCNSSEFADMHVFPYSIRPGTTGAHLSGQLPSDVKTLRARRLLELAKRQSLEFRRHAIGETRSVLWESCAISGSNVLGGLRLSGLTEDYIRVAAAGEAGLAKQITPVRLMSVDDDGVFAEVLSHVPR